MFITQAFAQTTSGSAGSGGAAEMLISIAPFVLIFVVMYMLVIRPQRTQMKRRQEMLGAIRRGDQVVLGGGICGKVTKVVDDAEVEVEIADGVKVRAVRAHIAEVRVKGEPVKE